MNSQACAAFLVPPALRRATSAAWTLLPDRRARPAMNSPACPAYTSRRRRTRCRARYAVPASGTVFVPPHRLTGPAINHPARSACNVPI